jgi:SOS response regulatory protein OraA/RecX
MAVGGLQAVRDALIFAYAENLIDDEEFALLYTTTIDRNRVQLGHLERR